MAKSKPIPTPTPEQIELFWAKVEVHHPAGCWMWTGSTRKWKSGYGAFCIGGEPFLAHRVAYTLLIGPVPDGLTLDHLCRNRLCVNPDHLEPVSNATNVLRGFGVAARNLTRTHCPQGHERTPENTYFDSRGRKSCRICRAIRSVAFGKRQREAKGVSRPKTHCKRGHEFTPENTYRNPSKPNERYCRACIKLREQDYIRPSKRQKVEAA